MQLIGATVADRGHEYTPAQSQQFTKLTMAAKANRAAERAVEKLHPGEVELAGHFVPLWLLGVGGGAVLAAGAALFWWATRD